MKKETIKKGIMVTAVVAALTAAVIAFGESEDKAKVYIPEDNDEDNIIVEKQEETKTLLERIPFFFRNVFSGIVTVIGSIVVHLIDKLVSLIANPVLRFLLSVATTFTVILLLIILIMKFLFPDMKIKDYLNKKMIVSILISSILINIIDTVLTLFVRKYRRFKAFVKAMLIITAVSAILYKIVKTNIAFKKLIENI